MGRESESHREYLKKFFIYQGFRSFGKPIIIPIPFDFSHCFSQKGPQFPKVTGRGSRENHQRSGISPVSPESRRKGIVKPNEMMRPPYVYRSVGVDSDLFVFVFSRRRDLERLIFGVPFIPMPRSFFFIPHWPLSAEGLSSRGNGKTPRESVYFSTGGRENKKVFFKRNQRKWLFHRTIF